MPKRKLSEIVAGQQLVSATPEMTVRQAVEAMSVRKVGMTPVFKDGEIVGVFSERDLLRRVVAAGRDPETPLVGDVMTDSIVTVDAENLGIEAVRRMVEHNIHHVVVTGCGERGCAVVTIGDFVGDEIDCRDSELHFQKKVWERV